MASAAGQQRTTQLPPERWLSPGTLAFGGAIVLGSLTLATFAMSPAGAPQAITASAAPLQLPAETLSPAARSDMLAAEQGNTEAQNRMGIRYQLGDGVPLSYEKAARLHKLAADKGDPVGQVNLALMYQTGLGIKQDEQEAARLYKLAADKGNAEAMYALSWLYRNGMGVPRDLKESETMLRLAASASKSQRPGPGQLNQ
jgi:TPR repeat protein